MATEYLTNDIELTSVADAIRAKSGQTGQLIYPDGFASAVAGIKKAPTTPYMEAEYVAVEDGGITSHYIKRAKLYNHTAVYAYEFANQYNLNSLDFSDASNNITTIEGGAFSFSGIGTIILPGSVTRVADFAFSNVRGVNSVTPVIKLNEGLSSIGNYAFNYAGIAGEMEIPSTVTKIGEYCFGDTGITTVICKPTTPPALGSSAFSSNTAGFTIKVPAASVAAYKAATNWSSYADYIVGV